jgi:type VI secretion system ImpC/EvpB family protein
MQGTVVVSDNLGVTLDARIAEIDQLLSDQLSEVMHHADFQQLESSWTGLHYLCKHTSTGAMMKIQVFNASKKELIKDFQTAIDFDQSALFKKVYEEEFGTFGGAPFGTLIGDFSISRQPEDMYFLDQMSHVAAASHAPFISAASPEMFGLETFTDLSKPRDLSKALDTVEYAKWKSFRETEDSRYVGLTVPRFLGRLPYNAKDGTTVEGFNFAEDVNGSDHGKYLWVNTAYAMGARLTAAFENYGWCAAIRGVEGGGLVDHRSARKGAQRPRVHSARALQRQGLRGVLWSTVSAEAHQVRHRLGQRQRGAFGPVAIHLLGVPNRALPEVDDARQDRQLRVCRQCRRVSESLDSPVRRRGRQRVARDQGGVSTS